MKTTEPKEEVSSLMGEMGVGSQKRHRNDLVPQNTRNKLEQSSCKLVEENHEKVLTGRGLETTWVVPD